MTQTETLARGRDAYERLAWKTAYALFATAAAEEPLEPTDLVRMATAAALSGLVEEAFELDSRAYREFLSRGQLASAARSAFWLCMRHRAFGDAVRANGWLSRARRALEECGEDCVEQGYVMLPVALEAAERGELTLALETFERARAIGQRFQEKDLIAVAQLGLGSCRLRSGSPNEGLSQLDEIMLAVEGREVSPLVTGILYCSVIDVCHEVFDLQRAQAWTNALTDWCSAQPDLVPFQGECQVHRAQVLQLHGAWPAALDVTESVTQQRLRRSPGPAVGLAWYQKAELHRLQGQFDQAEEAYRQSSRLGHVPEPGLVLLRLAQGQVESAVAGVSRALDQARGRNERSLLLPAYVEVMLAAGDAASARAGAEELSEIAAEVGTPFLRACAEHATGAVLLTSGDARGGQDALRDACASWQQLDAPYEAARTRELIGLASAALGDPDRASLELDAAAWTYRQLGAEPDLARISRHPDSSASLDAGGLTQREVEVLRLVAAGKTNRSIATELVLSEKTVARHVANIFVKLNLSTRSAATAYAYEHKIV